MQSASARGDARSQRERQKMDSETTNLFRRRDTFFGICEAVGQDFGFNPLYLRLAFIAPLFFFPVQTFAAYFALGLVVLASRRSEEHTSELQSLMSISYAVFCLKKKT